RRSPCDAADHRGPVRDAGEVAQLPHERRGFDDEPVVGDERDAVAPVEPEVEEEPVAEVPEERGRRARRHVRPPVAQPRYPAAIRGTTLPVAGAHFAMLDLMRSRTSR